MLPHSHFPRNSQGLSNALRWDHARAQACNLANFLEKLYLRNAVSSQWKRTMKRMSSMQISGIFWIFCYLEFRQKIFRWADWFWEYRVKLITLSKYLPNPELVARGKTSQIIKPIIEGVNLCCQAATLWETIDLRICCLNMIQKQYYLYCIV